jgi:hypothetical protein
VDFDEEDGHTGLVIRFDMAIILWERSHWGLRLNQLSD